MNKRFKKGVFVMSEETFSNLSDNFEGLCISCGEEQHGVEPDAEHYMCESCDKNKVFGVEQLLFMGRISFAV